MAKNRGENTFLPLQKSDMMPVFTPLLSDTPAVVRFTRELDPTRLINAASGGNFDFREGKDGYGDILDVGAGSGCHSLALKGLGKRSVAVDISPLSVQVMKERGLDARLVNFYDPSFTETFDTILMLMNGTGIIGNLDNIRNFFARVKQLLKPGGCLLIDSSDLRYLFEEEDGSIMIDLADDYYGQVDFQMQYKEDLGESFDWLYLDFNTLAYYAEENGFKAEVLAEGEYYDYLAKLTLVG